MAQDVRRNVIRPVDTFAVCVAAGERESVKISLRSSSRSHCETYKDVHRNATMNVRPRFTKILPFILCLSTSLNNSYSNKAVGIPNLKLNPIPCVIKSGIPLYKLSSMMPFRSSEVGC